MSKMTLRGVVGVLLGLVLGGTPAWAQLVVEPQALNVSVPQYANETRTVMLTNTGSEMVSYCLSFDRPLQQQAEVIRLVEGSAGAGEPCGEYGEILYRYDEGDLGSGWAPYSITMTSSGRIFVTEIGGALSRAFEYTPNLEMLREFKYPYVAEWVPFAATTGSTYDTESGTLWWMNVERSGGQNSVTRRVLLLEGTLDGEETGRRIALAPPDAPVDEFHPSGLSYDAATDLFYIRGILGNRSNSENWKLWAVDREGTLAEGYPLRPEPYPPPALIGHADAHGGVEGGPEGVRVEYGAYPPGALGYDRIVVTDRWGNSEGGVLETPVPAALFEGNGAGIRGNPLRSRIDPNGVMYMTFTNFEHTGIVGVRPHPLPPSWLVVDSEAGPEAAWDGELAPGESREIILTFRAGAREVGDYTSSLQAFEAESGEAVEVPLTLTVTEGTDAEGEGAEPEALALAVYPNPSFGDATVALALTEAVEVRVVVYDVLGRQAVVLHDGTLAAGAHRLPLDGAGLPAGVYLVRVEGGEHRFTERITFVR